jgi:hypothetical protein
VNGDGFADILIGANGADPGGHGSAGESYLINGGATLSGTVDLDGADAIFTGKAAGDWSGYSVSGAGDVNGDGFADILLSARDADPNGLADAGETCLFYGGLDRTDFEVREVQGTISLGQADARFLGRATDDQSGWFVSGAGDVNGDGFTDILIGAHYADPGINNGAGETYLYYGNPFLGGAYDLSRPDAVFQGKMWNDQSGNSVSGAGDVNGDGFDDIIIGAPGADPGGNSAAGEICLIYGSATLSGTIGLANANVTFQGKAENDNCGSVSGAGDVNGDGFDDILIGALLADVGTLADAGETYLIYGATSLPKKWPLAVTSPNVTFTGKVGSDTSGISVSDAGDVNGDGFDDILIGAHQAYNFAGETYLIYGSATLPGTIGLANANVTFQGKAFSDYSGRSVSSAGDVNGDGFNDILITAFRADAGGKIDAGETYLVYGATSLPKKWPMAVTSPSATFPGKAADDRCGDSVSGAGDVNGDGFDDILIAAYGANGNAGETYLVYGSATLSGVIGLASANATFQGKVVWDYSGKSVSGAGDVNGDGFDDILIGAYYANLGGKDDAGESYLIYGSGRRPMD